MRDGSFAQRWSFRRLPRQFLAAAIWREAGFAHWGTLLGAFMLRGIQSFLILLGVQPQWYILVFGLIVVLASLADRTLTTLALKK